MKVSLKWLSEYVDLKATDAELAHALTMAGLEVEEIVTKGNIPDGIVVGKILERNPHPNADKLSVCKVDSGKEIIQIVCGAPNCDAGKTIPLATLGTVFKDPAGGKDFVINKCKLRGVESFGMMCSARELGLSNEHEGLMILTDSLPAGKPLGEFIEKDTVYTVEITPNRPDWLSHYGVARDISALCGGALRFPESKLPSVRETDEFKGLVEVKDSTLCPRYTARIIRGVTVRESPEWMKKRLESVGIRPINNIVDITNFVMMEMGQPLHAFDRSFLKDGRIIVRRAADAEKIVALDGKTYELNKDMLVIADAEKPVAIAGVMGGEHSGVLPSTVEVLLESAYFLPASIRATSRKLGLSSDSSYRFERGVDPDMVIKASDRATALILELAGGQLVSGLIDVAVPAPSKPQIKCRFARIRSLLGMDVTNDRIVTILTSLGFEVTDKTTDSCIVIVPSFRASDVKEEADISEEIARIHGLDKLPAIAVRSVKAAEFKEDAYSAFEKLRNAFVAAGLYECVNTSMIDEKSALQDLIFEKDDLLGMSNPISLDLAIMRPSILPGILATVKRNISRKNIDIAIFEMGRVFCKNPKKFPEERDECVIALTGRKNPERFSGERAVLYDFYDLKGVVESVLESRRLEKFSFVAEDDKRFVCGVCAALYIDGKKTGVIGQIDDALTKGMRLQTPLYAAILQIDGLMTAKEKSLLYVPISQFPSTTRDVAFLAPSDMEHKTVIDFINKADVKNLVSVEIFDLFEDKSLGAGKKSMAYSLTFRSQERTLTDDEVNEAHEKLRAKLASGLGVELR